MQSESQASKTRVAVVLGIIFAVIFVFALIAHHHGRHKHHAKLVRTKNHKIYVENDDGSCYVFADSGGGADVDLPGAGSTSFRLPPGTWVKTDPPRQEDVAEEEEDTVEESDAGQPEADAEGDVGADSDGADSGDSGGSDSGGDSGGDGGGDGGGGDGG